MKLEISDVAVVGAGLSGLTCADKLKDAGLSVRVFDKARGPGGRMSTRRTDGWRFDHGAQYFTVRDSRFSQRVDSWRRDGIVAPWTGITAVLEGGNALPKADSVERYVGVPGMNAVCKHLASDIDVSYETHVGGLARIDERWRMVTEDGADLGRFDAVVISAPAPQTATLLRSAAPELAARAAIVEMAPCWAAMVGFSRPLDVGFDRAFVEESPLSWVARNVSKPGRPDGEAWVLHGSPEWSRQHLEMERQEAAERLFDAFCDAVGEVHRVPAHLDAHRWRFALPSEPLPEACVLDPDLRLIACGDWSGGPRVEGAFLSGFAAAQKILT